MNLGHCGAVSGLCISTYGADILLDILIRGCKFYQDFEVKKQIDSESFLDKRPPTTGNISMPWTQEQRAKYMKDYSQTDRFKASKRKVQMR